MFLSKAFKDFPELSTATDDKRSRFCLWANFMGALFFSAFSSSLDFALNILSSPNFRLFDFTIGAEKLEDETEFFYETGVLSSISGNWKLELFTLLL